MKSFSVNHATPVLRLEYLFWLIGWGIISGWTIAQAVESNLPLLPSGIDVAIGSKVVLVDSSEKPISTSKDTENLALVTDGDPQTEWCLPKGKKKLGIEIRLEKGVAPTGYAVTLEGFRETSSAELQLLDNNSWNTVEKYIGTDPNWVVHQNLESSPTAVRLLISGDGKGTECIGSIRVFSKPNDASPPVLIGHDLSTAIQLAGIGKKFSEDGVQQSPEKILGSHGGSLVRLRLWVDPKEGINGLESVMQMALRVKAAKQEFLLDFHYSDTWADPGHQEIPAAWQGQDLATLRETVKNYTRDTIAKLIAQGTPPTMVQIGNEVTSGILHPLGKISGPGNEGFKDFASLVQAGIDGVEEASSGQTPIKIMLHIDKGSNGFLTQSFFERAQAAGLSFDIIGISYYPFWNGSLTELRNSMTALAKNFKKPVMVAETAYPYTFSNGDSYPNIVGPTANLPAAFPATVLGQALYLRDLRSLISSIPEGLGLGLIYWEPAWIPGVGWKPGEGNAWDNQAMFDANGNALESLFAFE